MNRWQYGKLVKQISPGSKWYKNVPKAFVSGGIICTIGECVRRLYLMTDMSLDGVSAMTSITMIFLGALLTGLGLYDNIARHCGAGTAVPITGFANAVVSPAIEYKSEGLVLGTAAKMFIIAGPVLVYGTLSSVVVGVVFYVMKMF